MERTRLAGRVGEVLLWAVAICFLGGGDACGFGEPERAAYSLALQKNAGAPCLSPEEASMVTLLNRNRELKGLPAIAVSRSLVRVARVHVQDLQDNYLFNAEDARGQHCNMHSWSSRGSWKPVCYTSDHAYADLMRSKPREITASAYDEPGYEVAYFSSSEATPAKAMAAWSKSQRHRDLIFEIAKWSGAQLRALGVAIGDNYAVAWFGKLPDPLGPWPACIVETKGREPRLETGIRGAPSGGMPGVPDPPPSRSPGAVGIVPASEK